MTMAQEVAEAELKRRLRGFLRELGQVATLRGFQYFSTYSRGREEMVLSIVNSPTSGSMTQESAEQRSRRESADLSAGLTSSRLPYDQSALMLSGRTQRSLSGFGDIGVGLPPASPSEYEPNPDENSTLFLMAGYGRYNAPYVWVRSHHDRLVRHMETDGASRDNPLRLNTTASWSRKEVHVWEVIAELVQLCTLPAPHNPFAIDLSYFKSLPFQRRFLATAAAVHFLQQVIICQEEDTPFTASVEADLHRLTVMHFHDLHHLSMTSQGHVASTFLAN